MKFPIRLAIDSDLIFELTKIHLLERYDKDGIIKYGIENHCLHPTYVVRTLRQNNYEKPEILQDKWLGYVYKNQNNDKFFCNLNDIIDLYEFVKAGYIQLCATPIVIESFYKLNADFSFFDKYVTKIFNKGQYSTLFNQTNDRIIKRFIEENAVKNYPNLKYPIAQDKMSSASLLGLNFLIKRVDLYYDHDPKLKDENYYNQIKKVNRDIGLVFPTNINRFLPPHPINLNAFIKSLKNYLNNKESRLYSFTQGNLNKNNEFEPNIMPYLY